MHINLKRRIAVNSLFFLSGLSFSSWASRIPDIKLKLGLSEGELGAVLLSKPVGSLVAMPIAGWLVTKFGSRIVAVTAALIYPLVLLSMGLASSYWILALALAAFGMCGNMYNISVNTQAIGIEHLYGKTIMASFHGVWSLAGFTGGMIGALMIGINLQPEVHFLMVAVFVILVVLIASQFMLTQDTRKNTGAMSFRDIDPWLLRIGLIAFCGMLCEGCMFDWSGVYFQKVVKADKGLIAAGYIAFMSTMALGRFFSDRLTDRLGAVRTYQLSSLLICAGLLVAVILPGLVTAVAGFLLVGFGTSSVIPLSYSRAGRGSNLSPGIAIAVVASIGYFGFLVGPPLIGFIAETFNLRVSFACIALVGATIGLLATKSFSPQMQPQLGMK
jgi:MFS family permease